MRITIDFEITPRAKRALLWAFTPLAVLAGSAMIANAAWTADTAWMATGQRLSSVKLKALFDETDARLNALETGKSTPPGTIVAYGGAVSAASFAPGGALNGWALCDGSAVPRTGEYAALFAAIGTSYGEPGSATFNLPDFRGRFLRGVDGTAGNDPDNATRTASNIGGRTGNQVGSLQQDAFRSHTHAPPGGGYFFGGRTGPVGNYAAGSSTVTIPTETAPAGGNETRPKNVYVNYIIKL